MKKIALLICITGLFACNVHAANLATKFNTKSDNTNAAYPITNLFDGNTNTKWQSGTNSVQYIYVTLSRTIRFMSVRLEGVYAPDGFSIIVSSDNSNWTTLDTYSKSATVYSKGSLFLCTDNNTFKPFRFIKIKLNGNQGYASVGNLQITEDENLVSSYTCTSNIKNTLNMFDNDANSSCTYDYGNLQEMNFYLANEVKGAGLVINSEGPGFIIDILNENTIKKVAYSYTLGGEECVYIICPEGFNRIRLTTEKSIKVFSLKVISVPINNATLNYAYDDAGNMTTRTILIPASLREEVEADTIIPMAIEPYEDKFSESTIYVYPNPTRGILKVVQTGKNAETDCELKLTNLNGQPIMLQHFKASEATIDLSSKPAGSYLLFIKVGDESHQWTIIKQ